MLGSAQLMIEGERGRFVYTGDFKLARSYTCEPPEVKQCDVLLMECTYGRPQYVFPSRDEVEDAIVSFATKALEDGVRTGVLRVLARQGARGDGDPRQGGRSRSPCTARCTRSRACTKRRACSCRPTSATTPRTYDGTRALIWPPSGKTLPKALKGKPSRTAMLTGWAMDKNAPFRYGTDTCIPLSDHADYAALIRYIELAQPEKVLLNHGWKDFVWRLRRLGIDATYLEPYEQLALF